MRAICIAVGASAVLALSACQTTSTSSSKAQWEAEQHKDAANLYLGREAVRAYLRNDIPCNLDDPDAISAQNYLSLLSSREDELYRIKAWNSHSRLHSMKMELQFALADAAKAKRCFGLADELYRKVITVYTGSSYAAERERARIGIDDIREEKRNTR